MPWGKNCDLLRNYSHPNLSKQLFISKPKSISISTFLIYIYNIDIAPYLILILSFGSEYWILYHSLILIHYSFLSLYNNRSISSRLRLEKELMQMMDEAEGPVVDRSKTGTQLRSAYDELSELSLLRLKSQEFYCRYFLFVPFYFYFFSILFYSILFYSILFYSILFLPSSKPYLFSSYPWSI